jgi:hypothetical protein
MNKLKEVVDSYMKKVSGIEEHCSRCLKTERWGGSVVLMVVDAAFTSIGLNYFTAVVPKVEEFNQKFVRNSRIKSLRDFNPINYHKLETVWRNRRSWAIAKDIASYLTSFNIDDRSALRNWARQASMEKRKNDPVGKIPGVGIVTFQYLRMMGGVDTVMPDKIVKRIINEILLKAGEEPVEDDIEFVKMTEEIALVTGYRPVELCWMTWMVQPEGKRMRMEKYSNMLSKI